MDRNGQTTNNEVQNKGFDFSDIIVAALQLPGVKVDRTAFLKDIFKTKPNGLIDQIVLDGPVDAGISRSELKNIGERLMTDRTMLSAGASFLAGMPGGLAAAATIPADLIQFYGIALRMAQELSYLYGEPDLWEGERISNKRVMDHLLLYIGVMLGVGGAEAALRLLSSSLAKKALQKLPRQALMSNIIYRAVKSIARALGVQMNKGIFAKGVAKLIPFIGGVISGGMTIATMRPMGQKLLNALDEAHFDYTEEEFQRDWDEIIEVCDDLEADEASEATIDNVEVQKTPEESVSPSGSVTEEILKAKELLDNGIISEEEFCQIKAALIAQM